ncbi:MAG: sigma-54-dependent Fis family transcriptional regulator [candidate division NC10 bacterium]|nr:sigma-54-dependent Fis family transcriptional regulator [candidate division NC10 bacterium]
MSPPRILIVDDDADMVSLVREELGHHGFEVLPARSGTEGLQVLRDQPVDVVVTDLRMQDIDGMEILRATSDIQPEAKVIMITAFGSIASAIGAMRAGAFDYLSKPFEIEELVLAVQKAMEDTRLRRENVLLRGEVERRYQFGNLIGASRAMGAVFDLIRRVAGSDISVLITGESGTGKELVAKAIHYNSERRRSRFVPINCAGIPETLLESELFGYVRGAFTGATTSRKGLIEESHGGTLFLDEIAEMPMLLQAKLLRVLEDKEVRPLGSNRGAVIDFRVITASNRDPRAQVAAGAFREDLFFRLNVASFHLPPLRERGEDLRLLVRHFIGKHAAAQGRPVTGISREALALLEAYPWPGNVRELENAIERAVAFAESETIQPNDLPGFLHEGRGNIVDVGVARAMTLKDLQERYIARILEETGGDRDKAARILGVHSRTLRRRDGRMERARQSGGTPTPFPGDPTVTARPEDGQSVPSPTSSKP